MIDYHKHVFNYRPSSHHNHQSSSKQESILEGGHLICPHDEMIVIQCLR